MNKKRLPLTTSCSPYSYFYQNGKLGLITEPGIQNIDLAYNQQRKWGIILGPKGSGKTEIAKRINQGGFADAMIIEKYIEQKKKELSNGEEDLDEVTFE